MNTVKSLDERHLSKLTMALTALSAIGGLSDRDRELADDIIRKSFETASISGDEVCISKDVIRDEAKRICDGLTDSVIRDWMATDPCAERRIEEYVRMSHGWDGWGWMALIRRCREFALIRIVYAALATGKTVAVK